jgi:hypothetical protein
MNALQCASERAKFIIQIGLEYVPAPASDRNRYNILNRGMPTWYFNEIFLYDPIENQVFPRAVRVSYSRQCMYDVSKR